MSEIKEPEDAVRVIMDALQFLQDVKVKTEWPIPVVMDRQGKLAKDYTVKDWYLKMQEELAEALNEEISAWPLDGTAKCEALLWRGGLCDRILEENCDMIHTIFSKLHQFGFTEDEIAAGIHRSNEKAKERGLID
jgi:hypothetical protein